MRAAKKKKSQFRPSKLPTQARARATFESMLDAAARLLSTRGYEALTTNHVAQVAGVSIGSLYEYFPNKETLVAELIRRTLREILEEIAGAVDGMIGVGSRAGLRDGVRVMFAAVEARRELVRALWNVPFLDELEEVRFLPQAMRALAQRGWPVTTNPVLLSQLEASTYLLTVMVSNAVVYGIIERPRHLSREQVEESLSEMLAVLLFRDRR